MTFAREHEPLGLVDQLKSALSNYVGKNQQPVPWLTHCDSAADLFNTSKSPSSPQRFWLPIPNTNRNRPQDSQKDLRPVLIQLIDDRQAILQIQADGIVVDDLFGSLGLIQFCYPNEPADESSIEPFVLKTVREAMGLRSELLHRAENGRAYYVELVLVIPGIDNSVRRAVGRTLRKIMEKTGYLNAIGVNVLSVHPHSKSIGFREQLHRAFSWLLFHSRRWYVTVSEHREHLFREWLSTDGVSNERLTALSKLTTTNFRLAGSRTWKPSRECPLHIIHGFNGTGKSTIVDALELLLTNRVRRVEGRTKSDSIRYDDVLRNKDAMLNDPSRVEVELEDRAKANTPKGTLKFKVSSNGLEAAKVGAKGRTLTKTGGQFERFRSLSGIDAGCFRLEQAMSDQMTCGSDAQRAALILNSFFPDSNVARQTLVDFNGRLTTTVQRLKSTWPDAMHVDWLKPLFFDSITGIDLQSIRLRLSEFSNEASLWHRVLHIYCDDADSFLSAATEFWGTEWVESLQRELELPALVDTQEKTRDVGFFMNTALDQLPGDQERLLRIGDRIQQIFAWQCGGRFTSGTRDEQCRLVSDWLTAHVRYDASRRFGQLYQVAAEHRGINSTFGDDIDQWVESVRFEVLEERAAFFVAERERHWQELVRFKPTGTSSELPSTVRPVLSPAELDSLDKAIRSEPKLSQLIQRALDTNEPQVGTLDGQTIIVGKGDASSGRAILESIKTRESGAAKLHELRFRKVVNLPETLALLESLHSLCMEQQQIDATVITELEKHLRSGSELALALNEFLALLTPARWAYDDVQLSSNMRQNTAAVGFAAGEHTVSQILNTAELNALAISLFMLCAPRIPNPLNLLLLDDPLQNMDEVTVTAVARGLDRIMQLWRSPEINGVLTKSKPGSERPRAERTSAPLRDLRVMILLHSEEAVNRFRTETPCHIYSLPWLSPDGSEDTGEQVLGIVSGRSMRPEPSIPPLIASEFRPEFDPSRS